MLEENTRVLVEEKFGLKIKHSATFKVLLKDLNESKRPLRFIELQSLSFFSSRYSELQFIFLVRITIRAVAFCTSSLSLPLYLCLSSVFW